MRHSSENSHLKEYLLGEIIKTIRETDQKRIKIAVRTRFTNPIFDEMESDLSHVDYIWDKESMSDNFLLWQIQKIKSQLNLEFPEYRLADTLLNMLIKHENLPFHDSLLKILETYKYRRGEVDKIHSVKLDLTKISEDFAGQGADFLKLFSFITKAEPYNVAANPKAWGHLRHSLNVFWLGYYFLNSGPIDSLKIYNSLFGDKELVSKNEEKRELVNYTWFLASLFHDVGLPLEKTFQIAKESKDLLSIYNSFKLHLDPSLGINEINDLIRNDLHVLFKDITGDMSVFVRQTIDKLNSEIAIDHGLISGVTLLNYFSGNNRDQKIVAASMEAAKVAALHNIICKNHKNMKASFLKDNQLAALLVLCDQLEIWDRETGLESYLSSKIPIEIEKKQFYIDINYIPYRFISPIGREMESVKEKLTTLLIESVKPIFDIINTKEVFGVDIKVLFWLDGRKELSKWP